MPSYIGAVKHFISKVKCAGVQFVSQFTNPNHSNLSIASTVNETLSEFCEASYALNAIWTGGSATAQNIATHIYATRIGNRVTLTIDAFAFTTDTTGTSNTRITFSKKLDPRFVPNYDGVVPTLGTTAAKMIFPIVFYYQSAISATSIGFYLYGDGTITMELLDAAHSYGDVLAANTGLLIHSTLPAQSIVVSYDIESGAVKTLP